jgi:predicted P-loop ATPase
MKTTHKFVDALTGEETFIEREETKEEKDHRLEIEKQFLARQAEAESKATAKAALLEKLGITDAEAKLLLL